MIMMKMNFLLTKGCFPSISGDNLSSIENKADDLAVSAQGFRRGANRVRKQMWLKDMKMRFCLVAVVIILLIVIIVPIVVHFT